MNVAYIKTEKEQRFQDWLKSIEFVDENRKIISTTLEDDDSEDPDNDREE